MPGALFIDAVRTAAAGGEPNGACAPVPPNGTVVERLDRR